MPWQTLYSVPMWFWVSDACGKFQSPSLYYSYTSKSEKKKKTCMSLKGMKERKATIRQIHIKLLCHSYSLRFA